MTKEQEIKLVEVFAGSSIEANMVKSFLANADIEAFLKDDLMGTIAPWQTTAGGAGAVKVLVSSPDQEKAMQLIKDMENV